MGSIIPYIEYNDQGALKNEHAIFQIYSRLLFKLCILLEEKTLCFSRSLVFKRPVSDHLTAGTEQRDFYDCFWIAVVN